MDRDERKALFLNAVLMANADGETHAFERRFIRDFMTRAGIEPAEANLWLEEAQASGRGLAPLPDELDAARSLEVMIGTAAADGELDDAERRMLIAFAKTAGIDRETLQRVVHEKWRADVLGDLFTTKVEVSKPSMRLLAVRDHFDRLDATLAACPDFTHRVVSAGEVHDSGDGEDVIIFHAAPERDTSLRMLRMLRAARPDLPVVCILNRHDAFQISYLLEESVSGCIVEPVYPGELARAIERARARAGRA